MKLRLFCLILMLALSVVGVHAEEDPVLFTFEGREFHQSEVVRRATAYAQSKLISSETAYEEAIAYMIENQLVPEAKAAELGLDQYTEEERAALKAEADAYYEQQLDAYVAYFGAEMPEDQRAAFRDELKDYWAEIGTTVESAEETHLFNQTRARLLETMNVTITDEEIEQVFAEQTAKDEAYFKDNYRAYEYYTFYHNSDIWYVPEGYRAVLDLKLTSNGDDPSAVNQAAIDALYEALENGEPFADLAAPDGTVPEEIRVHEDSTLYSDEIVDAVFSETMEKPGSVSDPIIDKDGVHILCTVGDVPSGPLEMDARIRESIIGYLTDQKQSEILKSWMTEYTVVYNQPAIDALTAGSAD